MMKECRRGLTLLELIVVLAILGLLVAILLPAVQAARSAALRAQCANNLRQIGVALHQHAESHGAFPPGYGAYPGSASFLVPLLPYLEQRPLYDALNLSMELLSNENVTVLARAPGLFLCPADAGRTFAMKNAVNYAANAGRSSLGGEGAFIARPLAARDFSDGLASTVGVAEWIAGAGVEMPRPGPVRVDRMRTRYRLLRTYSDRPDDLAAFVRACETLDPADIDPLSIASSKGQFWLEGGLGKTQYNHMLGPNRPSCYARIDIDATTSGSRHGAGAHALTMDGSVRFARDSLDPRVWAALGTRAGGEADGAGPLD